MAEVNRWPAIILTYEHEEDGRKAELNCRIDMKPDTGKAHGVMIWRDAYNKNHHIDKVYDKIGRKISRVMQGRAP